jgi:S-adenosylmethionine:tRNA ribosyltransferase-isomerase
MTAMAEPAMKTSSFDYVLPPELIAQKPITPRDHSRLMVIDRRDGSWNHRRFHQLGESLRPGDVLVLNATRVFPARLRGRKRSGGKMELLLLRAETPSRWISLVRGAAAPGLVIEFPDSLSGTLVHMQENGEWAVQFSRENVRAVLELYGEMPLPPYIKRAEKNLADSDTYQTVFAREEGSIAAPTAGFHFTPELLQTLKAQGVETVELILHVGWGTFRPVRAEQVNQHQMLPEMYDLSVHAADRLTRAKREGRRIVAVGTTSVRTLESVYEPDSRTFRPGSDGTNLFIVPGYAYHAVDALITNFHLPHSTPLFLANAFYSTEPQFSLRPAYEEAIRLGYRFYSYGDAMFIQ